MPPTATIVHAGGRTRRRGPYRSSKECRPAEGRQVTSRLLGGPYVSVGSRRTFLGLYGSRQQCAYQMSSVHRPGPSWYPMWQRIAGAHLDPTVRLYHYSIIIVRGTSHMRASVRPNLNWDLGAAIHALPSTPVTSTLIHQSVV